MTRQTTEQETLDRVRRIETRITKIGQAMGVDVGGGRPIWLEGDKHVAVPSPNCSIGEIMKVVPQEHRHLDIPVFVGSDYLMTIFVDE